MAKSTYRRRVGDRKEGRLLRSLPGFSKFIPFIMPTRNDAFVFYSDSFEITEADRWLRAQRVKGYKGIGFLHVIIAAYIRCIAILPGLNRFVVGRHIYARNNIEVVLTVKKSLELNAEETTIKVCFEPTDTIYDVYRKMNEQIDDIKSSGEDNATEDFANAITKAPRFLFRLAMGIIRIMDYFGWLPSAWQNISPFHGSMIITDLGSLGIKPVYHHIYNFGTLPVFIAFGAKRKEYELNRRGEMVENKYLDIKATMDERIVDGHYYATVLKNLKYFITNPNLLENPPERVEEDIF
jgi:hypothetical protein